MADSNASEKENGRQDKRRRYFNLSNRRLPVIIILVLMLYISISLGSRFDQLSAMQQNLDAMQHEIKDLHKQNAGLYDQLEMLESNDYVEQVARERLGLVKPGEARIVTMPPNENNSVKD